MRCTMSVQGQISHSLAQLLIFLLELLQLIGADAAVLVAPFDRLAMLSIVERVR